MNEPKFTAPSALEPSKAFNYLEFQQILENPTVFSDDLKIYLRRPEVLERFTKPIFHFFPTKEQNLSEAWKNANISTFTVDNTPISKPAMDLITHYSNDLNISIVKTYECLNKVIKSNPELVKLVIRPDISVHYQTTIESMIINMIYKDRIALLRGINAVVITLDDTQSDRQQIIADFASGFLESNSLINALIEGYQHSDNPSSVAYFRKSPEWYLSEKLKEEFLILSSIFGLFSQRRIQKDFAKIYGKLLNIFLKQNFEGSINDLMDQLKLSSHNLSALNNDTSNKIGIFVLFILLSGVLGNLNLQSDRNLVNLPHLVTINKEISTQLKAVSETNRVTKVIFFQSIYSLIVKASICTLDQTRNASDISILESTLLELDSSIDEAFADNIMKFLKSARKFKQPMCDSFREIFKYLLEVISSLNRYQPDLISNIFINRDIKNKTLLKIFKETMKNGRILCEFWKEDFNRETEFGVFSSEFLNDFPFDKVNFLKFIDSILGSKVYPFAEEVLESLASLQKTTMEINGRLDTSSKDFTKSKNQYNNDQLELRTTMNFAYDISVPEGTLVVAKPDYNNVYEFSMNFNFWEFMYKDLTEFIVTHQGTRKVAVSDHIQKYIKLISKILIVSPNISARMQEMFFTGSRSNINVENPSASELSPNLLFVLYDSFRMIHDRVEYSKLSSLILQAIKSLLISKNNASVIFFTKLYPLVSDTEISPVHIFIDFYNSFRSSEGDVDNFRFNERYFYKGLADIMTIFKMLIADEEIWVSSMMGTGDSWSREYTASQASAENSLKKLAELYLELTNENSWHERADEIQSTFSELFAVNEFVSTNILGELWENLVAPICKRFLKDDFDVTGEHIGYKYHLYQALFEFINCFLQKISITESKVVLKSQEYKEDLKSKLLNKFYEMADALPIREMIIEALEVNIDLSKLNLTTMASQKGLLGIVNKHWSVNVEQRKNFLCDGQIFDFIATSLETLSLLAKTCRQEITHGDRKEESNILRGFYKDFCYRESIYKYKFDSFSDSQSVNIIVAIISSIILENEREKNKFTQKAVTIEGCVAPYSNCEWQHADQLFSEVNDCNKFLFGINLDLIHGRSFEAPKFMEKARSVAEAGTEAIVQILKFWHSQQKVKRPNLEDYVLGLYNELPNGKVIMDKFALSLTASISEGHSPAFELLLQLQEFQPRFLEEYLRVGESKEGKGVNSLVQLFANSLKNLSGMANVSKLSFRFLNANHNLFRLSLFVLRLLRSRRVSKTIVDQLWSSTFEILVENVFKQIIKQKEPFQNIFEFLYDFLMSGKFDYYQWSASFSWSFNVLRIYDLLKLSVLQDQVIGEITELICWSFAEKISKKNVHFIDKHAIHFFRVFSIHSQGILESVISEFIFNGHKILSSIQSEILDDVIATLNDKLKYNHKDLQQFNRTTFINGLPKVEFIQIPASKNLKGEIENKQKLNFDPMSIYLTLRGVGASQTEANKVSYIGSFYNQVELIMNSKNQIQAKVIKFLNIIYSVGIEGNYGGCASSLIPTPDLSRYIIGQCARIDALNNEYIGISHQLLHAQFMTLLSKNSELYSESAQLANDFMLQTNERLYLQPFSTKSGILGFSVINVLLKEGLPRITENSISNISDTLAGKLNHCATLLEYFIQNFLKADTFASTYSSISYEILMKIIHFTNTNMVLVAHLVSNLLSTKSREPSNIGDATETCIRHMTEAVPLVLHFYKTLNVDTEPFISGLLYSFHIIRILKRSVQPDLISPARELVINVLIKSSEISQLAIHLLDAMFTTNPDQVQTSEINILSERLNRQDISSSEFMLIIQVITNIAVNGDNRAKLLGSTIFKNILQIGVVSASRNFQQGILYHHQLPDENHAMFCHLLTLVSLLVQQYKDTPNVLHFALSFITKYQKRYELILGIGVINEADQNFDFTLQYQNQAFLEELTLILANLAVVSQESEFWMNKNKYQFYNILHLLTTRTIKIFSHELFNQNFNSSRFSQFLAVSDRFNPITRFEGQLQGVILKSISHTVPLKPQGSIMKSTYDPKTSLHSELNRFKDFKNVFLTQSSHSSNLFAFKLENLVSESIFSAGLAIASMMEAADFEEVYMDPSNNLFGDLFFRNFNHTLIDIQLFLLYAYQKLSIYPDTYKDGCIHMQMMTTSAEAKIQTRGVSSLGAIYALPEMKNIVRKAFEMSFYLQTLSFQIFDSVEIQNKHFYTDELKKQQEKSRMLLQDFESYLVRKENISSSLMPKDTSKFYSPIKSPYKSLAKITPRNIAHEIGMIDEETAKLLLVNAKSLDVHVKFLEFIRNYYNIK
jgi:hypothetical protein